MAGVQRAHVVHHREQGVTVVLAHSLRGIVVVRAHVYRASVRRHEGSHIQLSWEWHESIDLPINLWRVLETLQVEACYYGQCFQGQLFSGLAVSAAVWALDLSSRSEVLGPCETFQTGCKRARACHVETDVPERIYSSGYSVARRAHYITLETARKYLVNDAVAATVFLFLAVFIYSIHAVSENEIIIGIIILFKYDIFPNNNWAAPTYAGRQGLQWKIHEHPAVHTRLDDVHASISDARGGAKWGVSLHRSRTPIKKKKQKIL